MTDETLRPIQLQECMAHYGAAFVYVTELETELRDTKMALERLRTNCQYIFDKKTVRDWAETLAEVDAVLARKGQADE